MKLSLVLQVIIVLCASVSFGHTKTQKICLKLFVSNSNPAMSWRSQITHSEDLDLLTNARREKEIRKLHKEMYDVVVTQNSTPSMEFVAAYGVQINTLVVSAGYGSGVIPRYQVSNLGSSGEFYGTLLLPVSGHVGLAFAKRWAKSDTYQIQLSSKERSSNLIKNKKSLDIITLQDFKIKMKKGEVIRIAYNRSGSAGPGGFSEGRYIEFVWNGR